MICDVAVFGFTIRPETYTYLVPDNLTVAPGQLVEVPFGKRQREGVVVSVSTTATSPYQLKQISLVKSAGIVLTADQLKLMRWISHQYFISMAESIQLMLPVTPKTITQIDQSIKKIVKQELVLFPTLKQAEQARAELGRGLVYSPTLSARQFNQVWQMIRQDQAELIFGTRSAVFAPFSKLTKITIFQTESDLYKDERRPYYRTLAVAKALAEISQAKLTAVSYSPRVQDQYYLPHTIRKVVPFKKETVDLHHHQVVNDKLQRFLDRPGRTLVFLNRKSEKGALICRICKVRSWTDDPSICPNCGSADVRFELFNLQSIQKKLGVKGIEFATQQIFYQDRSQFDQIAILSADTYLKQGHYNSSEKTFALITELARLLKPGGTMLLQTAFAEEPGIKFGLTNNYSSFYEAALQERKQTGYPPFTKLAKLTYTADDHIPKLNLPDMIFTYGPFTGKHPYYVVKGTDLSGLQGYYRPWKLDIDPLSL